MFHNRIQALAKLLRSEKTKYQQKGSKSRSVTPEQVTKLEGAESDGSRKVVRDSTVLLRKSESDKKEKGMQVAVSQPSLDEYKEKPMIKDLVDGVAIDNYINELERWSRQKKLAGIKKKYSSHEATIEANGIGREFEDRAKAIGAAVPESQSLSYELDSVNGQIRTGAEDLGGRDGGAGDRAAMAISALLAERQRCGLGRRRER